jgi:hypothetical protein
MHNTLAANPYANFAADPEDHQDPLPPQTTTAPTPAGTTSGTGSSGEGDPNQIFTIDDLLETPPDPTQTLLGNRFLCRGGGMLFVGSSGVGKSSASMLMDISWACGRAAFGIVPPRALKILCVQAENDAGDLHEMAWGAIESLHLSDDEMGLVRHNFRIVRHQTSVGELFLAWLDTRIATHQPDLVRLDPLLAYLGGDDKDAKTVTRFCREGINPLIEKHNCGAILNHHTPKTNHRDTSEWKPSDWMYAGGGVADLTNWARAVVVVDATQNPRVFRFIAAKRGRRLGWTDDDGSSLSVRFFSHSSNNGKIEWIDTPADVADALAPKKGGSKVPNAEQFIQLLPPPDDITDPERCLITMATLEVRAKEGGFSKNGLAGIRDELERNGQIYVHKCISRNHAKLVGRMEIKHLIDLKNQKSRP